MSWEPIWKQLLDRDWTVIRGEWLSSLPVQKAICVRPDPSLAEIVGLAWEMRGIKTTTTIHDVPGLRKAAFSEALFLFHKGLHVLRASQRHAINGMPSWSLFSAYHSAYLTSRSTMYLLGVTLPQSGSAQYIIDLFPQKLSKHVRGKKTLGAGDFDSIKVIPVRKMDQQYFWGTYIRVLRLADVSICDAALVKGLVTLDWEKISPSRNKFIYNPVYWPYDDLISAVGPELLSEKADDDDLDPDRKSFLLSVAYRCAVLLESLMFDLAKTAPMVGEELTKAGYTGEGWRGENPLYAEFLDLRELMKIRNLQTA